MSINLDLFIWILVVWLLLVCISGIYSVIVHNGEVKEYDYSDSLSGLILLVLILLCINI
jgi:uncharacterized membrane protein